MNNFIEKFKRMLRHDTFTVIAAVFVIGLLFWLYGCDSKVASPFNPQQQVTRQQLIIQVETYNKNVELAFKDLERQDAFKEYLVNVGLTAMEGGALNPSGVVIGALGLLGLGFGADRVRKDTVIATLKNNKTVA